MEKDIIQRLDRITDLLERLVSPAMNLSVQEKAAAIRKALDTGDKDILKETLRQINGQ